MDELKIAMECPDCGQEGEMSRERYEEGYRGRCPTCQRSMIASSAESVAVAEHP